MKELTLTYPKRTVYFFIGDTWWACGTNYDLPKSWGECYQGLMPSDWAEFYRVLSSIPHNQLANLAYARVYFEETDEQGNLRNANPGSCIINTLLSLGIKARRIHLTREGNKWHQLARELKRVGHRQWQRLSMNHSSSKSEP